MDKDRYDLDTPYRKDNWIVFPQAVFGQINYTTCGDSGKCLENVTLEQCLTTCKDSMGGYYVEGISNSLCVPIAPDPVRNYQPYNAIRPSHLYKELENLNTLAFVNTDLYAFPPTNSALVTYLDNFLLKNVSSGKSLSFEDETDIKLLKFYNNTSSEVEFLPVNIPVPYISYRIPVKNNSQVVFSIPSSSMLLRKNTNDRLEWSIRLAILNNPDNAFTIHNATRPDSPYISFSDKVYFTIGDYFLTYMDETDTITLSKTPSNKLFQLEPKRTVYYLDATTCKGVPLSDTEIKDNQAYYEGKVTYRRSTCWQPKQPTHYAPYYILIFITIFIIYLVWKF